MSEPTLGVRCRHGHRITLPWIWCAMCRPKPGTFQGRPTGYDLLLATQPDDPAWRAAADAAIADGSALRMASTTDDVRRTIADLWRGNDNDPRPE